MSMTIQSKYLALIVIISLMIGAGITRIYATREVIKTVVQEKQVVVDHDVIQDHNVIVTKEIVRPDGSKEIDTTRTDDKDSTDDKQVTDVKNTTVVDKKAASKGAGWTISGGASIDPTNFASSVVSPAYFLEVDKTILGPVYIGGYVDTKSDARVSVGLTYSF